MRPRDALVERGGRPEGWRRQMVEGDRATDAWHTSTASGGGECVEVRIAADQVLVRDTKDRQRALLTFTHAEWRAFVSGVRLGEFDLPSE